MSNLKGMRWGMFGHNVVWVEAAEDIPSGSRIDYDSQWNARLGSSTFTKACGPIPKGAGFWAEFVK